MGAAQSTQWDPSISIDWTEEGADKLQQQIEKKVKAQGQPLNILVFGPSGCGKSSLCNGFKTALGKEELVTGYFGVGTQSEGSFTKRFQWVELLDGVKLFDMPGVWETSKFEDEHILNILHGKVAFTEEVDKYLNPKSHDSQETRTYISCVVLVLSPRLDLAENIRRIIDLIRASVGEALLLCHLVLTNLDAVDDCFKDTKNLHQFLTSEKVHKEIMKISEKVGIPQNVVSVVRNHATEKQRDTKSRVLFLHTFQQIINAACDQETKRKTLSK